MCNKTISGIYLHTYIIAQEELEEGWRCAAQKCDVQQNSTYIFIKKFIYLPQVRLKFLG